MNDSQRYLAVGLPVFAVLMNIISGVVQHSAVMARFAGMDNRFSHMDNRFTNMDARFDTLTGKVVEIDNRLTRLEAILERR
jgi:heme exporter protein D